MSSDTMIEERLAGRRRDDADADADAGADRGELGFCARRAGEEERLVDIDVLERLLLTAARTRRTMTYGLVLNFFERRVTRITVGALCRDLGVACRRIEERGGPDLACLVVRKTDGMPGDGWFTSMRARGEAVSEDRASRAQLVERKQERAFAWAALGATGAGRSTVVDDADAPRG